MEPGAVGTVLGPAKGKKWDVLVEFKFRIASSTVTTTSCGCTRRTSKRRLRTGFRPNGYGQPSIIPARVQGRQRARKYKEGKIMGKRMADMRPSRKTTAPGSSTATKASAEERRINCTGPLKRGRQELVSRLPRGSFRVCRGPCMQGLLSRERSESHADPNR